MLQAFQRLTVASPGGVKLSVSSALRYRAKSFSKPCSLLLIFGFCTVKQMRVFDSPWMEH